MELTFSLNSLRSRPRQFLISFLRTSPNSSTAFVNGSEIPNDQNAGMATMNYAARRGRLIRRQGPQIVTQSKFQNGGGNVPYVCRKSDPSWSSLFLPQTIAPHAISNTGAFLGSKNRPECYFPEDVFCCFCMDGVRTIHITPSSHSKNSNTGADSNSALTDRTIVSNCIWLLPIPLPENPRFYGNAISPARP